MSPAPSETSTTTPPLSKHAAIAEKIVGNLVQASSPAVSPDGKQVAFVVNRVDMTKNKYFSQVWMAATDGSGAPHPITGGEHDGNPTWSPDGTALAFTSRRSEKKGEATLHVMPTGTPGETRTIASMKDGLGSLAFSPDGRWIAFISRTQHERYAAEDDSWRAPRKIEHFFSRLNDEDWVFDRPSHVYVVAADGTGTPRNLTPGEFQHDGIAWLPDSSAITTSSVRHEGWDLDLAGDLFVVPLDGSEARALTKQTGGYSSPSPSPKGDVVAFMGADNPDTYPQNVSIGVVPVSGGAHRWISSKLDRTFETTAGAQRPRWLDESTLLCTAEDRGQTHLFRVFLDGKAPEAVTSGAITVKSIDQAGGTIAYCAGAVDEVSDVFVLSATGKGKPRRLTNFAESYQTKVQPQQWERFAVPCTDGTGEIDAWIMRPVGFDASKKYPVVLNVHGGPHTQYGETYFDEAQFQVAAGFVVLMSNPRGGSGREQTRGQAILGPNHPRVPGKGWGSVDVEDVMAVLDGALERYPFCDGSRVGMQGGSYGGYMATLLAGRFSDRFKAICSERSVNNLLTEEYTSDIATVFRIEHGLTHLDDPEEYVRMSPIRFVRDITCPMLLVHSEEDFRCPISQAEELFVAMRLLRKEVTFYRFPGESHELSRAVHQYIAVSARKSSSTSSPSTSSRSAGGATTASQVARSLRQADDWERELDGWAWVAASVCRAIVERCSRVARFGLGTRREQGRYMLAIIESVLASGRANDLAVTSSMHDLVIVGRPVPDPPMDVLIVRAPGSLRPPGTGHVLIEYEAVSGRNTRSERPAAEAVRLFWRFAAEKLGVQSNPASAGE